MSSVRANVNRGFTLIELLVVLCAIALIVSVLLRAGPGTRRQARTATCASRLGAIAVGMTDYAQLYDGAIAGSPITSGGHMFYMAEPISPAESDTMQLWNYAGPIRRILNGSVQAQNIDTLQPWPPLLVQKFATYRDAGRFVCPENDYTACSYGPAYDVGCGRMLSYNTSRNFLWLGSTAPSPHEGSLHWPTGHSGEGFGRVPGSFPARPPHDYEPFLDRVGPPASKVFIADGGRYNDFGVEPVYDARPFATYGGAFADDGPYTGYTHSWDRTCSSGATPGSTPTVTATACPARWTS
jgi:prepilin-type N-terminal cleavage/methylation domain-containing protein